MAVVKMKKIIIILAIILIGIVFLYVPKITPKEYFYLSEKQRKNTIEKLSKNCLSANILGLQVTYIEVFNDTKTAKCWRDYFETCLIHKENNLTLAIPIKCPKY